MTRQEWFNTLTPEVQEQFKFNTNQNETNNAPDSFFKFWIEQGSRGITSGIGGAFSFANTPQGFHYWNDIDEEARQLIKYDNSNE